MNEYTPDLPDGQSYYVAGRTHLRRQITGEQAIDVTPYSHEFDRMIASVERAAAARALEEFAQAQDSWCEQGRAEQVISRIAMRDALRARAEAYRQERGEQ